ncbi:MAG TPA: AAA family ATPase [Anaerolineales bacterium]|nr:AAA family ATPase [Anaerolineales bacterium]
MQGSAMTALLASYVPRLIQKRVAQNPIPIESPFASDFHAAFLFADISGFTRLTERLAEKGPVGVEKLASILNDYFGQLIDIVDEFSGDVVKFAGDAVIAAWPFEAASDPADAPSEAAQRRWMLRAAECAFTIRERLLEYRAEDTTLYLKFSLGAGRVWESHIGGIFNRWEFVVVGNPMIEIGLANEMAKAGEIIAAPSAWELLKGHCDAEEMEFMAVPSLKYETRGVAARLEKLKTESKLPAGNETVELPDEAQSALRPYLPGSIISRISAGQSDWLAELRKVTIVLVNLPGINHTSSLETAQETMRLIQQVVYRFEGSINKISQDDKGVMIDAAFGLPPLAHADDPARGIQAALMLRDELDAQGVSGSIGVTTGRVFCGLIGNRRRREYTFLGQTVNLAARLMILAREESLKRGEGNISILCDRQTYETTRDRAEFDVLPPQKIKGRNEPVDVFSPLREKKGVLRPQTELIGRKREKAILVDALQEAQRGAPFQAIVLHGEAGIGKSRLMEELLHHAQVSQMKVFSGAGDAIEKSNPYFAWRNVFYEVFGIAETISDRKAVLETVTGKLEGIEQGYSRYMPLLNVLLPISIPENEFTSAMTSEVRGGNIRDLLVRLLQNEADRSPILVSLEDVHWLDSASWTLLSDVFQKVRPLLLAVNTRPYSPPVPPQFKELAERAETIFIRLDMMSLDEVDELVCQRLGIKSMPSEAGRLIREKSEGHPFFAEELGYALRDSGVLLIEGNECRLAPGLESLNSITLPDNLEAAITSRIDGLNPSQQLTLKVASVIGRIFAYRMLHAIHPIEADKPALNEYLTTFTRMSLTLIEFEAPDMAYIFKHAVTQEVAYNLMLYAQRRQLHQAVAEWIESNYEHEIASYYALLAYHWIQAAGDPEPAMREKVIRKAVDYLEKAGDQSLNNFANAEAAKYFNDLLQFKEDVHPSRLQLGRWYHKLAMAYLGQGKLPEARANFLHALDTLGQQVPTSDLGMIAGLLGQILRQTSHRLFPGLHRRRVIDAETEAIRLEIVQILQDYATVLFLMGDPNPLPMFHSVVAGLNTAETIPDSAGLAYMNAQMGAICGFIPLRGQAKYYTDQWRKLIERYYNANIFVSSSIALATVESGIGAWEELKIGMEKVVEICNSLGDNRQAGDALSYLASNAVTEGNLPEAEGYNARLLESAMRRNNPVQIVWNLQWAGSIEIRRGDYARALEITDRARKVLDKTPVGEVAELIIPGVRIEALWRTGKQEAALIGAKQLLDRAAKIQVVDYSVVVGFFHFMDVIFLGLEQAYEQDLPQAEKDELMKYARLALKVMKAYARVFTVGEPAAYRYGGWIDWYSGRKEKALRAWRMAAEKAHLIPMHYEEGFSYLTLASHLPSEEPERITSLEKARQAFQRGGLDHWAGIAGTF